MQKPYLIIVATKTSGYKRFFESLAKLDNSVEYEQVLLDEYPGNLGRFNYFPKNLDKDRWWIFTDTDDVIFQTPLPDLDATGKDILVAFEGMSHGDNGIWKSFIDSYPVAKSLLPEPVFNMGCWAMKGYEADKMLFYLKAKSKEFDSHPNCDQIVYNLWLNQVDPKKIGLHPNLFTTLYDNLGLGLVKKENGLFVNSKGEPFSIVHANGNNKELLET